MEKIREKFRRSFFIVNKIYVFFIFIGLTLQDATLGFYYFILSILVYLWKTLSSRIPISTNKEFRKSTYVYKETESQDLKMDIWYPLDKHKKTYPLVYFAHGGGWISGFRNQPNNISWCKYLASKGFIVASIDYRYGYRNSMTDILSDYSDGISYLKKMSGELNIDKSNISLMGLSAGGHLALLYASYNTFKKSENNNMEGIKSVVAYYPPTNLKDILDDNNKSLFVKFATKQTMKGSPSELSASYESYSPINYISEYMIPTLIVHGSEDEVVPFSSSVKFVEKLKQYKIKHDFLVHKKAGHSFDTNLKDYTTINILDKTIRFIRNSIKKGSNYENN